MSKINGYTDAEIAGWSRPPAEPVPGLREPGAPTGAGSPAATPTGLPRPAPDPPPFFQERLWVGLWLAGGALLLAAVLVQLFLVVPSLLAVVDAQAADRREREADRAEEAQRVATIAGAHRQLVSQQAAAQSQQLRLKALAEENLRLAEEVNRRLAARSEAERRAPTQTPEGRE